MYPNLFTIPFLPEPLGEIKSYGFMLMIGFLSAIWLACRRAMRVQANPDVVLNMGLIALIAGVAGARLYFVLHYWESQFAHLDSPIWAALRIDRGGLEFWGGPILAIPCVVLYLWWTKQSIRWYIDIVSPSLMWGLAFGRMGCLLNGCCYGGVCLDPNDPHREKPAFPWAIRFPYGSPAMTQQYWFRQMTLPRELIWIQNTGESVPFPREWLEESPEKLYGPKRKIEKAEQELELLTRTGADKPAVDKHKAEIAKLKEKYAQELGKIRQVDEHIARSGLTRAELAELSRHYRSLPVHPAQVYGIINALLISWVLAVMFFVRERHGIVFGWMLVLKSITRFLLELIRQDNPLDVANMSLSQSVCVGMFIFGILLLLWLRTRPLKDPLAAPFVWPEEEEEEEKAPATAKA